MSENKPGRKINFGVMFSKIDVENRTVSGFATLDNIDAHGDIVEAEGSRRAFARFRGGLREMHTNNAVGTLVDFESLKKYVEQEDKVYDGIYVSARVSKGAQDTWEKVLDGTFKGFSIGGKIIEKGTRYMEDGSEIGVIKDYDLIELSLVDNPANPLATVMTVRKIGDTFVYNDDDVNRMNIFYHDESGDVVLSADDERDGFQRIGSVSDPDDTAVIRNAINDYRLEKGSDEPAIDKNDVAVLLEKADNVMMDPDTEGGANVATDLNKEAATDEVATEEVVDEIVEKAADVDETDELETDDEVVEVEKAADVAEVEDEQDDVVEKVTAAVSASVAEAIESALSKASEAAKESKDAASNVESSFEEALKSFEQKLTELGENLSKSLESLETRVADVESGTAVRKSADVVEDSDTDEDDGEKNFWRGSGFLGVEGLV